jgi:polynucleotide 5'-triphosphatase
MTRDERTGEVVECVKKVRLRDLNIYSPKRAADWRVSVNLEIPGMLWVFNTQICIYCSQVPVPVGTPTHTRRKDRISYSHEEFSIDLTQVTSTASASGAVRP